jgi:hypothetical protein
MICRTLDGVPIAFLIIINEKEMRKLQGLKVRGVQEKRKKMCFIS